MEYGRGSPALTVPRVPSAVTGLRKMHHTALAGRDRMRKFTVMTALSALVIATASGIVPACASSATECTDFLAPGTYRQVVVPDGAGCLSEGRVKITAGLWR